MGAQETRPRRSVVLCCFPCSNPWSEWASKRRCPGEALLLVVKVVQVVFLYIHDCRKRHPALLLVVKVVQVVFPCVHVDSAGNASKAKRCYLLFPLQQPMVCMGLEEAMSWRSVVHCCKGCSSCFSLYPRDFLAKKGKTICGFMGFPLAARAGNRTFAAENE